MDTNLEALRTPVRRGKHRHHLPEFKRAVVEETLRPCASVALIAHKHGINANQVSHWRKLYREGRLGDASSAMLPGSPLNRRSPQIKRIRRKCPAVC